MPVYQPTTHEHAFSRSTSICNFDTNTVYRGQSNHDDLLGYSTIESYDGYWTKMIRDLEIRDLDIRTLNINYIRLIAAYTRLYESDPDDKKLVYSLNKRIENLTAEIRWILKIIN